MRPVTSRLLKELVALDAPVNSIVLCLGFLEPFLLPGHRLLIGLNIIIGLVLPNQNQWQEEDKIPDVGRPNDKIIPNRPRFHSKPCQCLDRALAGSGSWSRSSVAWSGLEGVVPAPMPSCLISEAKGPSKHQNKEPKS